MRHGHNSVNPFFAVDLINSILKHFHWIKKLGSGIWTRGRFRMYSGESYECHRILGYNVIRLDAGCQLGIVGTNIRADYWSCYIAKLGHNAKSRK